MSNTKRIKIASADVETLRNYLQTVLGVEPKPNATVEQLRAKISSAVGGRTTITVFEGDETQEAATAEVIVPRSNAGKPDPLQDLLPDEHPERVRLQIHVQEKPGGSEPVQVGVNGKVMLIPRGKEVEIPWTYYEVLCKAVETHYDPLPDGGLSEPRFVPRYPHTLLTPIGGYRGHVAA